MFICGLQGHKNAHILVCRGNIHIFCHDFLNFLKKCIILSRVSCEAHFAGVSSSWEKPVSLWWYDNIFSNGQEASLSNSANQS